MRICNNCNTVYENDTVFCTKCGGATSEYYQPAPNQGGGDPWISSNSSTPSASAKVMSYIGLGLAIEGLVGMAIIFMYFFMVGCSVLRYFAGSFIVGLQFSGLLIAGGSIAGLCLTSKASYYGVRSGACSAGRTISIIGLALYVFFLSISSIACMVSCI